MVRPPTPVGTAASQQISSSSLIVAPGHFGNCRNIAITLIEPECPQHSLSGTAFFDLRGFSFYPGRKISEIKIVQTTSDVFAVTILH